MKDITTLFLILFVVLKIVDFNNLQILDVLIVILLVIDAILTVIQRRKED